jgi:ABC-type glycerol-3-phosphate transport system permease component
MSDNFSLEEFPAYVEHSSRKPKILFIFAVVFILVLFVLAGLFFMGTNSKKPEEKIIPQPTATAAPTETPTATVSASVSPSPSGKTTTSPTPSKAAQKTTGLDRSKLQIAVLNGSGTAGAAKGISTYLNGLGYSIKTVANADRFDYTQITVKVKKSNSKYLEQLKKDVSSSPAAGTVTAGIDDTIATDAEVIVGK